MTGGANRCVRIVADHDVATALRRKLEELTVRGFCFAALAHARELEVTEVASLAQGARDIAVDERAVVRPEIASEIPIKRGHDDKNLARELEQKRDRFRRSAKGM